MHYQVGKLIRIAGVALFVVACVDPSTPLRPRNIAAPSTAVQTKIPADIAARISARGKTLDSMFSEVEGSAPGYGGSYYDPDGSGTIVLRITDQETADAAAAAFRRVFPGIHNIEQPFRFKISRYGFRQLARWQHEVEEAVEGHYYLSDVDEFANQVHIGATDASELSRLSEVSNQLGIPSEAIRLDISPKLYAQSGPVLGDSVFRPLLSGVGTYARNTVGGTSYYGQCSVGHIVTVSSQPHYVTASHCTAMPDSQPDNGTVQGGPVFQPGLAIADSISYIGYEVADGSYSPYLTGCGSTETCRYGDVALIKIRNLDGTVPSVTIGKIAKTTSLGYGSAGSTEVNGQFTVTQDDSDGYLLYGSAANKVGSATGWTFGSLGTTCAKIGPVGATIDYSTGTPRTKKLLCQWTATTAVSDKGDSGAPVFIRWYDGATGQLVAVEAAGVLWGGTGNIGSSSTFSFTPMSGVRGDLGSMVSHQ